LTGLLAGTDSPHAPTGMSVTTESPAIIRVPTREVLLSRRRGRFLGLTGDQFVKYVIIVLALITFTIFRDAVGFLPANHDNLKIYRLAGLEYVDLFREQVTAHSTLSRYLASVRAQRLADLTQKEGLAVAAAQAQLAAFDDYANRFADTIGEQETLLGNWPPP
jgi:phosphate transport system permease protein